MKKQLTQTVPTRSRADTRCARCRSSVNSCASRPYGVSLASADRLVLGVERLDDGHRAEDLLAEVGAVGRHVDEDGRLDRPAVAETAGEHPATDLLGGVDVAPDLLVVLLAGQRPELRLGVERIAEAHRLGRGDEAGEELVVDRPLRRARDCRTGRSGPRCGRWTGSTTTTALSRSASAKTRLEFLPPISSETGTRFSAAARLMIEPVRDSPVKVIRSTRASRVSASPTESGP